MLKKNVLLLIILITSSAFAQAGSELADWLKKFPGLKIETIEPDSIFTEAYKIYFPQHVDHNDPESPLFYQLIYLSHSERESPVVIDLEGYEIHYTGSELSDYIGANQLVVEHRFFGESLPDSVDWKYMNIKQAATDHHKIIDFFNDFYTGKWISTGISKGGQTVMYHRYFFPDDVDISVPVVAPLNFSARDPRVHSFINRVATAECRNKVYNLQTEALKRKNTLLPLFKEYSIDSGYTYKMGYEAAFEYMVMEYSFAYWQWGDGNCNNIPSGAAPDDSVFSHLIRNSSPDYFSDKDIKKSEPFFYQAFTQLGYYDYDTTGFSHLLNASDGSNHVMYQNDLPLVFNAEPMIEIDKWLKNDAKNFIFIYGEYDPWSACQVNFGENKNCLKMIKKGGSHRTRIKSFPPEEREIIYDQLEKWLGMPLKNRR